MLSAGKSVFLDWLRAIIFFSYVSITFSCTGELKFILFTVPASLVLRLFESISWAWQIIELWFTPILVSIVATFRSSFGSPCSSSRNWWFDFGSFLILFCPPLLSLENAFPPRRPTNYCILSIALSTLTLWICGILPPDSLTPLCLLLAVPCSILKLDSKLPYIKF